MHRTVATRPRVFRSKMPASVRHKHARALNLSRFVGLQTPYDASTEFGAQMRITQQIVRQHRLGVDVARHAMQAWHNLQTFPHQLLEPTCIGVLFEHCFAETLPLVDWRRGRCTATEKDIVCVPNPTHSIEIKTTSTVRDSVRGTASMHGAIRAYLAGDRPRKVRDGYHLIVSYNRETLRLRTVRFGWLQDVDFFAHNDTIARQPYCPASVARSRFWTLYDDEKRNQKLLP